MSTSVTKTVRARGASLVEYAFLLFAVLIIGAVTVKTLGPKVKDAGTQGAAHLVGEQ